MALEPAASAPSALCLAILIRRARLTTSLAIKAAGKTIRTRIGNNEMIARIRKRMIAEATSTPSAKADFMLYQNPTAFTIWVGVCKVTLMVERLA